MKTMLALLIVAVLSGCATGNQAYKDRNESTLGQARNADVMRIAGTNITFNITGATEIVFSQIVNPIASPKTALETVTAGAVSIAQVSAPIAGGVLLARELSDRASDIQYTEKISDTRITDTSSSQINNTTTTTTK